MLKCTITLLYFFENSFHVVMLLCSEDDIEDIHKVSTQCFIHHSEPVAACINSGLMCGAPAGGVSVGEMQFTQYY